MYNGNPLLKGPDEKIVYTKEMQEELIRCMSDIIYFGEKHCYIVTGKGRELIKFYEYQKRMLKALVDPPLYSDGTETGLEKKKNAVMCCPRQCGKTTISSVYLVHFAIFNPFKNVAVLANKQQTAFEIMSRIKMIIEGLPPELSPNIKEYNKSSIIFGNGSKIEAFASSSSAIRGKSLHLLFLDEFGFILPNICKEFMDSVYPTITANKEAKIIMVSTPNGMNQFYDIWSNAVKGKNQFFPIKIHWWEHPDRDEEFKKNMIRDRGVVFFSQEFQCFSYKSLISIRDRETGRVLNGVSAGDLHKYGKSLFA